jgi:hypothetical protein
MVTASILWRRLDTPGHDACTLATLDAGWVLDGTAVFRHEGAPARLSYRVECDAAWRTEQGQVRGSVGARALDFTVLRSKDGTWALNGDTVGGLETCVDLDLGFTPATNLTQLRRIALAIGGAAEVPVAWLDVAAATLALLPQRYERRGEDSYWYEAPSMHYAGLLETDPAGFIRRYPGLWEIEP